MLQCPEALQKAKNAPPGTTLCIGYGFVTVLAQKLLFLKNRVNFHKKVLTRERYFDTIIMKNPNVRKDCMK